MIEKFLEKGFKNNRWFDRYFKTIDKFGSKEKIKDYERHHVLPKFMFSEFSNFNNNPWNSIYLSKRAHFIAHYCLAKAIEKSMWNAVVFIGNTRFGRNLKSRLYEEAKIKANKQLSERQVGDGNVAKRPEVREKMKKAKKKYFSENDSYRKGKTAEEIYDNADEVRKKMSNAAKNRIVPNMKKIFHLTSPNNFLIVCIGNLKEKVNKYELSLNTLKKFKGNRVPTEKRERYNTILRNNSTGWRLDEI